MLFKNKKFVIGALHLMPLVGYQGYIDYKTILEKAKGDLRAFQEGGVDGVIVENNYNLPHRIKERKETIEMMKSLMKDLSKVSKVPLGVSVLWNDYGAAFSIAKDTGSRFIRVPVFVDSVRTDFGDVESNPDEVITSRKKADATDVLIFADIQVKHAEMVDKAKPLRASAREAKEKGADAIIITGKWTGEAPTTEDLEEAREAVGEGLPIIVGSGASKENVKQLFEFADGAIVSTSLKEGEVRRVEDERNLKPFLAKIDVNEVKAFKVAANGEIK